MSVGIIISLVAAGFLLVCTEVFIPGGVLGIFGAVLILIGIILGFTVSSGFGAGLLAGSIVFGMLGFYLWVKFFPRSPIGKRMILQNDAHDWQGFDPKKKELIGKEGVAHTPLRPAGIALIDGQRVDVVTRGEMIGDDARVRVIDVEGNRVVVTAVEESAG